MPRYKGGGDKLRHQKRFLAAFAECGIISWAARWAKVQRDCHYEWLKEDSDYRLQFAAAEARAARGLVDEAVRRGRHGVRKPVWHKGKIVGYETEFSDRMLELTIRGELPNKYRSQRLIEHTGAGGGPIQISDLTKLRGVMAEILADATPEQRAKAARLLFDAEVSEEEDGTPG